MISKAFSVFSPVLNLKAMPCRRGEKESVDRIIWAIFAVVGRIPTLKDCLDVDLTMELTLNAEDCPTALKARGAEGDLGQLKAPARFESERRSTIGSVEGGRYAGAPLSDGESK